MLNTEANTRATQRTLLSSTNGMFDSDLLTVSEVGALLKVPVSWVYERTRRRGVERIPHFKLGKYLRFREPEVLNWLDRMRRS
jgi:excisionase family DNA binding protein